MTTAIGPLLIEALPRLRRYAISLARVADVADDLVQAACERALATTATLDDDLRFDAWMFRIVRNLWYDRLRRLRARGEELDVTGARRPRRRRRRGGAGAAAAAGQGGGGHRPPSNT